MNKGQLIELGLPKLLLKRPLTPITRQLLMHWPMVKKLLSLDLAVSKLQKDLRVKEEIRQQVKLSRFRQQK